MCVYSQSVSNPETDGVYLFSKATLTIYNFDTKQEVDLKIVEDPSVIETADFHFANVFLQATIQDGKLFSCMLPDEQEYKVSNNIQLEPFKEKEVEKNMLMNMDGTENISQLRSLKPYSFTIENDILTFEVLYPFGDSTYDFPLEGKLTVVLTKQQLQ